MRILAMYLLRRSATSIILIIEAENLSGKFLTREDFSVLENI